MSLSLWVIQQCHAYLCFLFEATANSTGECGPWFLDSPRHSVYTRCTGCSEAEFDSLRVSCCVEPEKCNIQSSSSAYCFRFALPSQKKSCEEAGCTGEIKIFFLVTPKKKLRFSYVSPKNFPSFSTTKKILFCAALSSPTNYSSDLQTWCSPGPSTGENDLRWPSKSPFSLPDTSPQKASLGRARAKQRPQKWKFTGIFLYLTAYVPISNTKTENEKKNSLAQDKKKFTTQQQARH